MSRLGKFNFAQKSCVAKTGYVMQHTGMLFPGARVGVAVSGGVDSMTLIQVLCIRKRIIPFPIELMVLHVNPGFEPRSHEPLLEWCRERGLGTHVENTDIGPRAFSAENRKNSPCFFCSMLRRKALFDLCKRYGLTHLALGHNADDLAATFLMNLVHGGRVDGLSASEDFFGGELKLIRPLLHLEKSVIRRAARAWKLPVTPNACPAEDNTERSRMNGLLEQIGELTPTARGNVFNALRRWQLDLDTKQH